MKLSLVAVLAALTSGAFAAAVPAELARRANTNTEDVFDDADPRITYSGDWTHLKNQGNAVNEGTLSYSNSDGASLSIPYGDDSVHTGFFLRMGAKADRGDFSILLGDNLWYSTTAKGSCTTDCPENDLVISFPVARSSDPNARLIIQSNSPGKYLAFDSISLHKYL